MKFNNNSINLLLAIIFVAASKSSTQARDTALRGKPKHGRVSFLGFFTPGHAADNKKAKPGSSYCTWAPDYDCYSSGWPSCCSDESDTCPEEQPSCDSEEPIMGASYCTSAPDYKCYSSGWPSCCDYGSESCPEEHPSCERWTMSDFKSSPLKTKPYVVGHGGLGVNDDEDRTWTSALDLGFPTENTIESVAMAFEIGVSVVEIDVQLTAQDEALVFQGDHLDDSTCVNQLTEGQLQDALPEAPKLKTLLSRVHRFSKIRENQDLPTGFILVNIQAPSPLCDPTDTTEEALVTATIDAIQKSKMTEQVAIVSSSPLLLQITQRLAPEIPRGLSMSLPQFLSPEELEVSMGQSATVIDKDDGGLELQWREVGQDSRLPAYASPHEFVATALAVDASSVALDKHFLERSEENEPESGAALVRILQALGVEVDAFTFQSNEDWSFMQDLGVDGIYSDFVEQSLGLLEHSGA